MNQLTTAFVYALLSSLPYLLIAAAGIALVHIRLRESHAKAKRLATFGLSLLALQALGGQTARLYLSYVAAESGNRLAMANDLTRTNLMTMPLLWTALILILLAVVADRNALASSRGAI